MSPRRHDYSPVVSYAQAHLRLKNDQGRPSGRLCAKCEEPAHEWAYMGGCPNELVENGKKYSLTQSLYKPMCYPCHRRQDRALAGGRSADCCPSGHAWNAENTGIRIKRVPGTGLRFCRACHRASAQRYRAIKKAESLPVDRP